MFGNNAKRFGLMAALMLIAAMTRVSTAEAHGYMVGIGISGEVACEPGGSDDCPTQG